MLYRTIEVDELVNLKDADRAIVDLMENNDSQLKLIALKKHEVIDSHTSHTDACLYVIDGELEIKFQNEDECTCATCGCDIPISNEEDGKKYKIKKGQMFFFEKNVMHELEALKDSTFMMIKI